jgi:hypothetical protein
MGFFTRKNKKNNALKEARNVEERAAYNLEHKHSKVGNILSNPGKGKWIVSMSSMKTNKNGTKNGNKNGNKNGVNYYNNPLLK